VWRFIRAREVPVCSLYAAGYTSLGPRRATVPNPKLRREDGSYLPAHLLPDPADERLSRAEH
jgi:FAD synthetase